MHVGTKVSDETSAPVHPHAWIQDTIVGLVLTGLGLTIPYFVWLLVQVQDKVGLSGGRIWAFVIGFAIIELYLIYRVRSQVRKAVRNRRAARAGSSGGIDPA